MAWGRVVKCQAWTKEKSDPPALIQSWLFTATGVGDLVKAMGARAASATASGMNDTHGTVSQS